MRVITGTARGRRLETLQGNDVRPTTDKVKESLFSIIQFQLEGRHVLDLFAGSGQLGIEALSRGARSAVFVDVSRQSVETVKKNLTATGLSPKARVFQRDSLSYLSGCGEKFDIALLDPPYRQNLLPKALPLLAPHMNPGGIIVCERPAEETLPGEAGEFIQYRQYRYGKIKLTTYRHKDMP